MSSGQAPTRLRPMVVARVLSVSWCATALHCDRLSLRRTCVASMQVTRCSRYSMFSEEHRSMVPCIENDTWDRLELAAQTLLEWNDKINVISRKELNSTVLVE